MKKINILIACTSAIILYAACKKNEITTTHPSLSVINAAIGSGTVKVNYFGKPINWANYTGSLGNVNFGSSQILTIFNLNNDYPFTIVPSTDTTNKIVNTKLPMNTDGIYSLYLIGEPGKYDYIYNKEANIPYNLTDSSVSIRFINLSPNSPSVNITLASTPTVNEVQGLAYKSQSNFKQYPLPKVIPIGSVTFQIKNSQNDMLLASYTLPTSPVSPYTVVSTSLSRFKSITLVIKGLSGTSTGANAYGVFPVTHY